MDPLEDLSAEENLCQLWMLFSAKNEVSLLRDYVNSFLETYAAFVDPEFIHLSEGFMEEGPHSTKLPEGLLQTMLKHLRVVSEKFLKSLSLDDLLFGNDLLKCLIVICRNLDNVSIVSSSEFVGHVVAIDTGILNKLCRENSENVELVTSFMKLSLHLFECLYDPYFVWRKKLRGWRVDKHRMKFKAASLYVGVVPFFFECFQTSCLDFDVQSRLFHVFGSILSGSQSNALKAICPATLDVLLSMLSSGISTGPSAEQQDDLTSLKDIILQCIVGMVQVLHTCSPEERQVEVGLILSGFFKVLLDLGSSEANLNLQLRMLDSISEMLIVSNRAGLQSTLMVEGLMQTLLQLMKNTTVSSHSAQVIAVNVVKVMQSVFIGSMPAKEDFKEKIGFISFAEAFKQLGQPSKELLEALLDLVTECKFSIDRIQPIRNGQAVLILVQLLPIIYDTKQQVWLAKQVHAVSVASSANRMLCCSEGLLSALIEVLNFHKTMDSLAVALLLDMMESLGSWSISGEDLAKLLRLLMANQKAGNVALCCRMLNAMSVMASPTEHKMPRYFLDLQAEDSGILTHSLGKWIGSGFTFHAWICLDSTTGVISDLHSLVRRQLYSIQTSNGTGFEAFFTCDSMLTIAVMMKKEYYSVQVQDHPILDSRWHCIDVVHSCSKNPFSQSYLTVYIDGKQHLNVALKFPSITQEVSVCKIGSPRVRHADSSMSSSLSMPSLSDVPTSKIKSGVSGVFSKLGSSFSKGQSSSVLSLPLGQQDEHFGVPVSIIGQLSSVCILQEPLLEATVKALYTIGPNRWQQSFVDDNPYDLNTKQVVLHYDAKAHQKDVIDLSPNENHGKLVGRKFCTWDIREVINCIGGIQVLFPLLDLVKKDNVNSEPMNSEPKEPSVNDNGPADWVMVQNSSDPANSCHDNQVACFITLLCSMTKSSEFNQETLVREVSMATLGVLLQEVASTFLDDSVHSAIRSLVESVSATNKILRYQIYQYILFDFRIWCKCEFNVSIGHIQYLSTIIKDDKKHFRKTNGVQFMLDVIRTYYSSSPDNSHLCAIRGALLSLVKFYVGREISFDELNHLVGFIISVKEQILVLEVLDLLISLLEQPGKRDQIFLLLFEPNQGELFYVLLTKRDFSVNLRERVVKFFSLLLRTNRVYEKHKGRMRLLESGIYPGLTTLMADQHEISAFIAQNMLEQVLLTDSEASINAVLHITQLFHFADLDIKLEASKQLLIGLFSKATAPKVFAKQTGWQEVLVRLFITQPKANIHRHSNAAPSQDHPTLLDLPISEGNVSDVLQPQPADGDSSIATTPDDTLNDTFGPFDERLHAIDPLSCSRSSTASAEDLLSPDQAPPSFLMRQESTASSVVSVPSETMDITTRLQKMGLTLQPPNEQMEKTEEMCQNLLIILFTVLWKGIEQSDETAWKERSQVFTALSYTNQENDLLKGSGLLRAQLMEMMLQGCLQDLKEAGQTNPTVVENAMNLVKLLYNFLCVETEDADYLFKEQILEDVLSLLELLSVWESDSGWLEMEQMGLRILLAFAAYPRLECCSMASARLHNLLQVRPVDKMLESCYVMTSFHNILTSALNANDNDRYSFLLPVMRALIDKCRDLLNMETLLPKLPSTEAPSFFEEFQKYCQQEEWMIFMRRQVIPSSEQYDANIFEKLRVQMTTFMGECHEAMMIASHLRSRERGESKLKFQEELLDSFHKKTKAEERRYQNVRTQLRQQQKYALRQWRSRWAFYSGDRGIWFDGSKPNAPFWKLSSLENSHRMRPKLIPNYNYDPHLEASALRDNIGSENESKDLLSLAFAKEALCRDEDIGDDRLGDEEWNLISAANAQGQEEVKVKLSVDCELVTIMDVTRGQLEVTNTHVYFLDCSPQKLEGQDFKWSLSQLREIHFRRYNLRRSALEFFLVDQSNYFLNFKKQDRNKVYSNILRLRPPNLIYATTRSPTELLKDSDLTRKWLQREISNFEYLMHLNTIAGRTYNDLSQYPVFPWILSNYDSDTLDLDDVSNYRDLSKPIGTINPKTEAEVREKYEHFEDPTGSIPKFHYGTHYSNPAGVMHFLIRMEPFTTLHIQLQGGRFDVADRQFHSIASTWQSQIENANDVKELVPEFFYLPEFLENINDFDLGRLQNGHERVDDVVLPRWAVSSYDFINKHNRALESEYVSAHLHEWIDLIFGYKQRGPAAAEALNVFYYCTYEGAVDLDSISDPVRRKALEGMINNFGQTPTQLLKDPHPKRMTFDEAITKAGKSDRPLSVFLFLKELATFFVEGAPKEDPVVFICVPKNQVKSFITTVTADSMVVVTQHGVCGIHSWLPYNKSISHFYTFEKDTSMFSRKLQRTLGTLFAPGVSISPWLFAVTHDAKLVLSGGHWDNSLCVYSVPRSKTIASIVRHNNIITCLALDNCGKHLITGSRDATCIIWDVMQDKYGISTGISTQPLQVLCGHDAEVTAVAISIELDMAVSGSKDGTVIIYTVRKGTYMRTLRPPHEKGWRLSVQMLAISEVGHVCVYCQHRSIQNPSQEKLTLHLYSINGKHMSMESIHVPISHMIISGNHLVFGNKQGVLIIKELFGLRTLSSMPLHVPITCLAVTNGNSHILLGLRDGNILIIGIKRQPEVKPIMG